MADVTLTYKGATIAELNDSGSKTLRTAGKFCEADIGLAYAKPAGGLNYSVRTVPVSNNLGSGIVDRDFENFIFIAELAAEDFPATLSSNTGLAIMFVYFDGTYLLNNNKGVYFKSADATRLQAIVANPSGTSVSDTSIQFSTYSQSYMYLGNWKVLQIELPADYPIYNLNLMLEEQA